MNAAHAGDESSGGKASAEAVHMVLEVEVAGENAASWSALMHEMVAATVREPDTLIYEWYEEPGSGRWRIHERYADSAACDIHVDGFIANFGPRFLELASSVAIVVHGDPSDHVRGILKGLSPTYLSKVEGFARW